MTRFAYFPQVKLRMVTCGLIMSLGENNVFNSIHDAVRAIVKDYERRKGREAGGVQSEASPPLQLQQQLLPQVRCFAIVKSIVILDSSQFVGETFRGEIALLHLLLCRAHAVSASCL